MIFMNNVWSVNMSRSSASNEKLNPKNKIIVGISSCLLGQQVRFDGGHKRLAFAVDDLSDYFEYQSVYPEMEIGLPTPRPALRLVKENEIKLKFSDVREGDLTDKMLQFHTSIINRFSYPI